MSFTVQSTMDLRTMNKKKIFSFIRSHAESTRKDVSNKLGLSFGTVATICNELIEEDLVSCVSSQTSNGGRIPDLISLKANSRYIACLDLIEKNQVMLALCNLAGKIISSIAWDTAGFRDFASLKSSIVTRFQNMIQETGTALSAVIGMGIAVPAINSHESGLIIHSTNPLLENILLVKELEEALQIRAVVENESNLLAMAMADSGNSTEAMRDIVYLYINEGLGTGIICNGKLLLGTRGFGGEINYLPIGQRSYRCYCGNDNCAETELSMAGFLRKYREASGVDLGQGAEAWRHFEQLVADKDRSAVAVVRENAQVLGGLVASLCNLFDPERVLIGGMLDDVYSSMEELLMQEFKKHLAVPQLAHCPVVLSPSAGSLLMGGCVELVMRQWMPKAQ